VNAAGGAIDDGLGAPQQDFEAVLFDRGVETADDGNFCISQSLGEIIGFEDKVAGAFDGAEEGDRWSFEQVEVADRSEGRWGFEGGTGFESRGIGWTVEGDGLKGLGCGGH